MPLQFDHEKLIVYQKSIHFVAWAEEAVLKDLPESAVYGEPEEIKNKMKMKMKMKNWLAPAAAGLLLALPACQDSGSNPGAPVGGQVKLGIDVLEESGFAQLRGKRVGLITNQTSVNRRGVKTREILHRAPQVNLTALFTPEHGLDGTEKAAAYIATRTDPLTGVTAHSLYGSTRKPTPQMLSHVDVLLFDLQDIGSRSYTYISTMALAMEACGENNKEFIVLDRPNPIGGLRVQGPPVEQKWRSFVGQLPTPYVHGMTAGELARMSNDKGWMKSRCRLTVIPMEGWRRNMAWEHTGLRWVATSPNIPNARSPFYYVATGILGSLTGGDIGIGTDGPFEFCGGKNVNPQELTAALSRLNTPGIRFTPYTSPNRPGFAGSRIHIDPNSTADLVALDISLIYELNKRIPKNLFANSSAGTKNIFYKVYGSESIERDLLRGVPPGQIIASWQPHNARFQRERQPFLLYP